MKYESEFKIKEKEFRPRKDFKHDQVIEELANIVKRADLEIDELSEELGKQRKLVDYYYRECRIQIDEIRIYQYLCVALCLCIVALGMAALS